MTVKVGINGFGRIGRNFFRAAKQARCGHRLRRGERHHRLRDARPPAEVRLGPRDASTPTSRSPTTGITVDGDELQVLAERDPAELPWKELGAEIVIESTGLFTERDKADKHIEAGRREGRHQRAGQGRGPHGRHGRERRRVRPDAAQRDLERLVHHELRRARWRRSSTTRSGSSRGS